MAAMFIWAVCVTAVILFVLLLPSALRPRENGAAGMDSPSLVTSQATVRGKWEYTEEYARFRFPNHYVTYVAEFELENGRASLYTVPAQDYANVLVGQRGRLTVSDDCFYAFTAEGNVI